MGRGRLRAWFLRETIEPDAMASGLRTYIAGTVIARQPGCVIALSDGGAKGWAGVSSQHSRLRNNR